MIDIYVINLKNRVDKLENFNLVFSKYFKINVIDAIKNEVGWKGCLDSHLKCIKYAKDNNLKYIIVFEDDATPKDINWYDKFMKIKEEIFEKRNDWDIYLGGTCKIYKKEQIIKYDLKNDVYKVAYAKNTHCIVYNNTCYDFFLNCDKKNPIDMLWHQKINCIMSIPYLFTVRNFVSDISKKWIRISSIIHSDEKKSLEYVKLLKIKKV